MTGDNRRFVDTGILVWPICGSMHHAAASMMLQQADAAGNELWILPDRAVSGRRDGRSPAASAAMPAAVIRFG
jgi:hypothetical protein